MSITLKKIYINSINNDIIFLNKDGSYTSSFEYSEPYSGDYVIFDNTLILAHKSNYEDKYIVEEPLEIAEDCSYIIMKVTGTPSEVKFTRK